MKVGASCDRARSRHRRTPPHGRMEIRCLACRGDEQRSCESANRGAIDAYAEATRAQYQRRDSFASLATRVQKLALSQRTRVPSWVPLISPHMSIKHLVFQVFRLQIRDVDRFAIRARILTCALATPSGGHRSDGHRAHFEHPSPNRTNRTTAWTSSTVVLKQADKPRERGRRLGDSLPSPDGRSGT